jgi:predicted alpha-1,6-mannanase (GH76 family)
MKQRFSIFYTIMCIRIPEEFNSRNVKMKMIQDSWIFHVLVDRKGLVLFCVNC